MDTLTDTFEEYSDKQIVEKIFMAFQDGIIFRLTDEHIEAGVKHTSMMVSDIVEVDGTKYMILPYSLKKLD